jgi:hypothetical protein
MDTGGPAVRTANVRTIGIWTLVALVALVALVVVLVALVAAAGRAVLAPTRGEHGAAAWTAVAALGSYAVAYRFCARFIAYRVLKVDKSRATPADRGSIRRNPSHTFSARQAGDQWCSEVFSEGTVSGHA